jgi:hypothetical protein
MKQINKNLSYLIGVFFVVVFICVLGIFLVKFGKSTEHFDTIVYEGGNYSGKSNRVYGHINSGNYSKKDMGVKDRSISSIIVDNGYRIVAFDRDNFDKYANVTVFTGENRTIPREWNDRISSFKVEKIPTVQFYKDCNFQNYLFESLSGDLSDLSNYKCASIKIPPGYTVTVFSQKNYQGSMETFNYDQPCLWDVKKKYRSTNQDTFNWGYAIMSCKITGTAKLVLDGVIRN